MSLEVIDTNEIALDIPAATLRDGTERPALGVVRFKVAGAIRPTVISAFPTKTVTGDYTRDTDQIASSHIFSDFTGGVGVLHMKEESQFDRYWDSTLQTLYKNQLTLPWKAIDTGNGGASGAHARAGVPFSGNFYVAFDADVHQYDANAESWGSSLKTLANNATDAIEFNGKTWWAYGSGYTSTSDFSTWDDQTDDADWFCTWDSKLWRITSDGTSFAAYDPSAGTWTPKATLQVPSESVQGLDTFYAADGSEAIIAITKGDIYIYDSSADKWRRRVHLPRHPYGGLGHALYRDNLQTSAGVQVFNYTGTAVSPIGPDRDWGLPGYLRGRITRLVATPAYMVALLDSTFPSDPGDDALYLGMENGWGSHFFTKSVGLSSAWLYNDRGWHHLWRSSSTGTGAKWAMLTDLYDEVRLWIGADNKVYYIRLPDGFLNPLQGATGLPFAQSGYLITPWFDGQWSEIWKLGVRLTVKATQMSATEIARLYVAYDGSETWSLVETINADGEYVFDFNDKLGQDFKKLRFKIEMARGSDELTTPNIEFFVLSYLKLADLMWAWAVPVIIDGTYKDHTAEELREALEQAVAARAMIPMAYRDANGEDQTKYVRPSRLQGSDEGGTDPRGRWDLSLLEV